MKLVLSSCWLLVAWHSSDAFLTNTVGTHLEQIRKSASTTTIKSLVPPQGNDGNGAIGKQGIAPKIISTSTTTTSKSKTVSTYTKHPKATTPSSTSQKNHVTDAQILPQQTDTDGVDVPGLPGDIFSEQALLEQCLNHQAYTLGPTHIDTMKTLHNLAVYMYQHNNDRHDAKKLLNTCYEQQKFTLGPKHDDTVLTMNNIVLLHHNEGQYDVAKKFLLDGVSALIDNDDTNLSSLDAVTYDTILQLAFAFHRDASIDDAMELYKMYLAYSADDSEVPVSADDAHLRQKKLSAQHNLAVLYQNEGNYEDATPLIQECLYQRKELLGDSHPLTLGTLNNLAALFHKSGAHEKAMSLYQDCLELKIATLGAEHPDTLLTYRNLERLRDTLSA